MDTYESVHEAGYTYVRPSVAFCKKPSVHLDTYNVRSNLVKLYDSIQKP